MAQIKFSHHYFKHGTQINNETVVTLLQVLNVNLEDLSESFKEFDTRYYEHSGIPFTSKGEIAHYKLPEKGKFLLLIMLLGDRMIPTLRRWTPEKEKYYFGLIGKEVEMIIEK